MVQHDRIRWFASVAAVSLARGSGRVLLNPAFTTVPFLSLAVYVDPKLVVAPRYLVMQTGPGDRREKPISVHDTVALGDSLTEEVRRYP